MTTTLTTRRPASEEAALAAAKAIRRHIRRETADSYNLIAVDVDDDGDIDLATDGAV